MSIENVIALLGVLALGATGAWRIAHSITGLRHDFTVQLTPISERLAVLEQRTDDLSKRVGVLESDMKRWGQTLAGIHAAVTDLIEKQGRKPDS